MCCCNCNKENEYLVRYKWLTNDMAISSWEEATEFVTTDNIKAWWLDFKDEDDELISITKL